jgi:hypothetical protein
MNKISKNENGFGAIESLLIVAVVVLLGAVGYMVYKNHNKTTNSSTAITTTAPAKTTTTQPAVTSTNMAYTDAAKAYAVSYPQDWTIKEEPSNGLSQLPVLDSTEARFTPSNLPAGASGNTWIGISSFKSSDMAAALDAKSATQSLTINGYKALYYQAVVPATKGTNGAAGGMGYTDDYYAVTNNGVTLVFYFREKQDGNGIASSFDASSIVPAYTALVKSVKFLN